MLWFDEKCDGVPDIVVKWYYGSSRLKTRGSWYIWEGGKAM